MKNSAIFLAVFLAQISFGQVNFLSSYSLSFEKQDLKKRIGQSFALAYDVNKIIGVGLQVRDKELWRLNSKIEEVINLRTLTGQFYVHGTNEKGSKWLFFPVAGVLAGLGEPIERPYENLLKNPFVFGVFSETHFGRKLSKNFYLGIFFRIEGEIGILRDRKLPNENLSTAGFLSGGLRLSYNLLKSEK